MTTNRRLLDLEIQYPPGVYGDQSGNRYTDADRDQWVRDWRDGKLADGPNGEFNWRPFPGSLVAMTKPFFPVPPTEQIDAAIRDLIRGACPKCHRPDCGLTATVIIGESNWRKAVAGCIGAQRKS